ncbi:MAG: hypothetical protein MK194_12760 [Roseibacillus sp.]|nr:hypothetical protein [Roseibacillus sp.]
MSRPPHSTPLFSFSRIGIIAGNTFTHLMRMKIFYFLLVFVLIWLGLNVFKLPHTVGPESMGSAGGEELRLLKAPLVGTMKLFAIIIGIVATALLIPRDVEDRTLYTILAKPVPRLDYLLGKLFGVLLLILAGLTVMTLLLDLVLWYRAQGILTDFDRLADILVEQQQWTLEDRAEARTELLSHGVTWSLQAAILVIFFEAAIIAALALLVSTFSTSTLFTVVISTLSYFIGNFIADGLDHWQGSSGINEGSLGYFSTKALFVAFPDYRPFKIVDEVLSGQAFPPDILGSLALSTGLYVALYAVLSWFIFTYKEI